MSFEYVSDKGSLNFSKPVAMLWLFSVIWSQWVSHHHYYYYNNNNNYYYYYYYCHYRAIYFNTPVEQILLNLCDEHLSVLSFPVSKLCMCWYTF